MGMRGVLWLSIFLFALIPCVSGTIVLSPQPSATAYLGDVLNSTIFVSSSSVSQGLLSASLLCANFRLDYYTIPVYVNSSTPARVTLPAVPFNVQMLGDCKILMQLRTFENVLLEQLDSFTFTVRNTIGGNVTGVLEQYDPNQTIGVEIRLSKPGVYRGTVSMGGLLSSTAFNITGTTGAFSLPLSFVAPPGRYTLSLELIDGFGNTFSSSEAFTIRAVARTLNVSFGGMNTSFLPGTDVPVHVVLRDQIGNTLERSGSVSLVQEGRVILVQQLESRGALLSLGPSLAPGQYVVRVISGDLAREIPLTVLPLTRLAFQVTGERVSFTNTGNVPYERDLTLTMNDGERQFLLPAHVSLLPEARQTLLLGESLPVGSYTLSLTTPEESFNSTGEVLTDRRSLTTKVSQGVSLFTGRAIVETDDPSGFIGLVLLIVLLSVGIYYFFARRFRQQVYGTLHTVSEEQGRVMHSLHHSLQAEQKASAHMRELFGKYVDQDVLTAVERTGNSEMQKQPVTTLFCDLRGFSTLFADTDEVTISRLLDLYLSTVSKVVKREQGMINKFVGDAAMALFNAPRPLAGHALHAIRAGLALQKELVSINRQLEREGLPRLRVGIGIASGTAAVGTLGKGGKTEYTAIGTSVNLAARLQAVAQEGEVLIDSTLAQQLAGKIHVEKRGRIPLKNIGIHEVYRVIRA